MIAGEPGAMVVAGVMSGTSADGVDVALVRVSPGPALQVIGHKGYEYSRALRTAVLAAMDADSTSVAELSRLNWRLGQVYADCVEDAVASLGSKAELIGMHGQTLYHQANAERYVGGSVRATWQTGEAAVLRERLGVPVISDFRAADLAAGGQGAPLVPMMDWCVYRSHKVGRVLLNLGGIANVTVLPAGCALDDVKAFDTGPGNMVLDAVMRELFGKEMDAGGEVAMQGQVVPGVVEKLMTLPWFRKAPPKSCGREEFGEAFARDLILMCGRASNKDKVRTAAELTVRSVAAAVMRYGADATEVICAGGGVRNAFVMGRLAEELPGVKTAEAAQAKEAVAFALLAWLSWFGLAGNVSSATGAAGPRVLGKILW